MAAEIMRRHTVKDQIQSADFMSSTNDSITRCLNFFISKIL